MILLLVAQIRRRCEEVVIQEEEEMQKGEGSAQNKEEGRGQQAKKMKTRR